MAKQLKEIEIPFGANDSELCSWEYTIPEGMEVTIVDNKIVVKKKESEDERIRKTLINFFDGWGDKIWDSGIKYSEVVAWLEKQGKHANFRNKIQIGDKVTRNDNGELVNLSQLERVAKKLEKQGEQKPAEEYNITGIGSKNAQGKLGEMIKNLNFLEQKPADKVEQKGMNIVEEDMTPFQKKVFCIIDTAIEEEQGLKQVCEELLRLAHDESMQKPAWSEEDENMCLDLIQYFTDVYGLEHNLAYIVDWLKSLKDRVGCEVNCTTTKEWSEEDERERKRVVGLLEGWLSTFKETCYAEDCKCGIEWLRTLKDRVQPQNTWKPSDEQMKILSIYENVNDVLASLYQDLKKLKEE